MITVGWLTTYVVKRTSSTWPTPLEVELEYIMDGYLRQYLV
jgi:hypothetical protein